MITKRFFLALLATMWMVGCTESPVEPSVEKGEEDKVNQWIYSKMTDEYLWDVPGSPNYNKNYSEFFNGLLKKPDATFAMDAPHDGTIDRQGRWSPYSRIEVKEETKTRSASGQHSFGFEFGLTYFGNSPTPNVVYAYVYYVVPGSPADVANIKRGDWIREVNDQTMTLANYTSRYPEMTGSSTHKSVKLVLVDIYNGGSWPPVARSPVTLTAEPVDDSPVHLETVFPVSGRKIAYMVYNGFGTGRNPDTLEEEFEDKTYEKHLKDAFRNFATQGATDLVVDLRYNPGGYVTTCRLLTSLIRPAATANHEKFAILKRKKGSGYAEYFLTSSQTEVNFTLSEPKKIYVLTSQRTASASEMLINGLRGAATNPVIVHHVGDTTEGKNVGSDLYEKTFDGKNYSMRPIVFQVMNANGESNYANGFLPGASTSTESDPKYMVDEFDGIETGVSFRLKEFLEMDGEGYPLDPLLRRAVDLITGKEITKKSSGTRSVGGSGYGMKALPVSSLDFKPWRGAIRIPNTEE